MPKIKITGLPQMKKGGIHINLKNKSNFTTIYKNGGTVSELWTQVTGTPWREAKKQGLTDGSFNANMALMKRIQAGEFNQKKFKDPGYKSKDMSRTAQADNTKTVSPEVLKNIQPIETYTSDAEYQAHLLDPYSPEKVAAQKNWNLKKGKEKKDKEKKASSIKDINLESGMITDKNKNIMYVIKNGKVVKQFDVGTGVDRTVNPNQPNKSVEELEKMSPKEAAKYKITARGAYISKPEEIYGASGFGMYPIDYPGMPDKSTLPNNLAQHIIYGLGKKGSDGYDPVEGAKRLARMKGPGEQRNISYGCTNMFGQDIDCLTKQVFPKGDTTFVVDTRIPEDVQKLQKYGIKKNGGYIYEGGGEVTPMYNPAVPEVSLFDLTKQAMGGLIYAMGGPTNPPVKLNEMQKDSANYTAAHLRMHDLYDKAYQEIPRLQGSGNFVFDRFFRTNDEDKDHPDHSIFINNPTYKDFLLYRNIQNAIEQKYPEQSKRWREGSNPANYDQRHSDPNASIWFQPTDLVRKAILNTKALGGRIKAGEGYVQNEPSDGFAYGGMYATSDSPVPQRTSGLMNYLGYAQGGTKLPTPILRSRLEAHMSPEEANDYIANYADGGNTGTGILGNMTFNPQPWKYVAGGQLGPYPSPSYKTDLSEFKKGGIHIKPEKRGTFTAAATKHGMGVQEFARKVMANKENYSPAMVKKANFARNAAKWKHAYGGTQPDLPKFYPGGPFGTLSDPNNPLLKGAQQAINDNTYTNQTDFFSRNAAPINQVPSSVSGPMSLPDKTVMYPNTQSTKSNLYYPGQFLSQSLGELSYLGEQGKGYETDPEYTYTPELMSAKTPIDAINESGRLAAANLRTGSGGAGNIYLANMTGLGTNLARTKASTIEGQKAANLERMNQARLMNLQAKQASDLQTAQNRAQALQNYYATIGSLGMKGAITGKDIRSEEMDKYKWQYLPQMFKAIEKNPELYKLYMQGATGKLG